MELTVTLRVCGDPEDAAVLATRLLKTFEDAADITLTVTTPEAIPVGQVVELAEARRDRRTKGVGSALRIERAARRVMLRGEPLSLTRLEFDLLVFLSTHPGVVFDRSTLLAKVWGTPGRDNVRTVDVHVRKIRDKLGSLLAPIATVHGVGYRFDAMDDVTVL
jgi:DNA-binding response OmpR family regulator